MDDNHSVRYGRDKCTVAAAAAALSVEQDLRQSFTAPLRCCLRAAVEGRKKGRETRHPVDFDCNTKVHAHEVP